MEITSIDMPWETITLAPIGDTHLGSPGAAPDRLKRHIEWVLETQTNPYFIGMGDYVDLGSPSTRQKIKGADFYDVAHEALREHADRSLDTFIDKAQGTESRWLGFLSGHHFYEYLDGSTTDTRLVDYYDTIYLGQTAFIRLRFHRQGSSGSLTCTIFATHGQGSGAKQSSPLNKLENMIAYFDADIYLMGHYHRKPTAPIDQVYMSNREPHKIQHRTKLIATTGGFLRSYVEGQILYPEQKLLSPTALGGVIITIQPVHAHNDDRISIHASV